MGMSLESMAIEMPKVFGHPNRVGFRGVLTVVDAASDKAPAGARGHRVLLTRAAAEEAIEARRKQAEKDGKPFERRHITPTKRASK